MIHIDLNQAKTVHFILYVMPPVHHQVLGDQGHHHLMMTEWPITLLKIS